MTVEPSIFPLFIEDNEISSVITLINGTSVPSPAVLTIRDLQGKSYPPLSIPVAAHAKMQIKVSALLQQIGTQLRTGSILVAQGPGVEAPSIVAQLTLSEITATPVALTEEELVMPMLVDSQDLRSISESATDAQLIAITSLSTEPQNLTTQCYTKGSITTKTTTLAPAGTALVYPCSKNSPDIGGASLLGVSDTSNATGISIHSDGPNGGFAAFGLSRHKSSTTTGFLGSLQFVDPTSLHSSSLVFTGISAGYSLTPGAQPYSTAVALANFGAAESHVKIVFQKTDVNRTVSTTSQDVVLAPQSSTQVPLGQLGLKAGEIGSLVVTGDQQPGDLIAKIVSSSDSAPNQLEQLAKDGLDDRNGGAHPWTLQDNARSDLILFNHSSKTEPFNIWITSDDGTQWNQSVTLAPFETRTVSINDLIRNKTPDSHGRTLPVTAKGGSVVWQTPVPGTGSGHILIRNEANASGESFSCGVYSSICGGEFTQYTTNYDLGQTATFGDFEADVCLSGQAASCSGSFVGTGNDFSYFWQSSNSSVLSLADNGYNVVDLTANSPGLSDISFYVTDGNCGAGGDATGTVPDQTPVVTGIDPSDWPSDGTTNQVTFTGQNFGTNTPTLSFDPGDGISYSLVSWNDSTIVANITVASGTPDADVNVSVTSNGYNGLGFISGGTTSPTGPPALASVRGGAPTANISIKFCRIPQGPDCSKSPGDQLLFSSDLKTCSEDLGLEKTCSTGWYWNIEGKAQVSDDATNWTVTQTVVSERIKGMANDGRGTLFNAGCPSGTNNSSTCSPPTPDGPESWFLQQTADQQTIYWLDAPGFHGSKTDNYYFTLVQNFETKFCSKTSGKCFPIHWHLKLIVKPGMVLDTQNTEASLGYISADF